MTPGRNMYAALKGSAIRAFSVWPFTPRPRRPALPGDCAFPYPEMKQNVMFGIEFHQGLGGGQCNIVGNMPIIRFRHPHRRNTEAKEAGVKTGEFGLEGSEIEKIGVNNFAEFFMPLAGALADDREDRRDLGITAGIRARLPDRSFPMLRRELRA